MRLLACLIVAPQRGYDEPAILSYAISSFCPTSADGLQVYGYGFAHGGPEPSIFVGAAGDDRRDRVLAAAASPNPVLRTSRRLRHRTMPRMALCNRARMPIMRFDGLGCRADAAEITPMEPVWVDPHLHFSFNYNNLMTPSVTPAVDVYIGSTLFRSRVDQTLHRLPRHALAIRTLRVVQGRLRAGVAEHAGDLVR